MQGPDKKHTFSHMYYKETQKINLSVCLSVCLSVSLSLTHTHTFCSHDYSLEENFITNMIYNYAPSNTENQSMPVIWV